MNTSHRLALVAVAGILAGGVLTRAIQAQQTKPPPAYVIAEVERDPSAAQDPEAAKRYAEEAPRSLIPFNGQYVIRGGKAEAVEGPAPKGYIVVIGFDSLEKARAWYYSPAYEAIKPIRQRTTKSRILIVEGITRP